MAPGSRRSYTTSLHNKHLMTPYREDKVIIPLALSLPKRRQRRQFKACPATKDGKKKLFCKKKSYCEFSRM